MKHFLIALTCLLIFSCKKNEDPCPLAYYDDFVSYFRVISFIDKDSTNLLAGGVIDTSDLLITDEKGVSQKTVPVWDSTFTKMRYVLLPLLDHEGSNTIRVTVKNKINTITYRYVISADRCRQNSYYDNFKLNGDTYNFKPQADYFMFGTPEKPFKNFAYINPLYIVLE